MREIIYRVNNRDEIVEPVPREVVHQCGWWHRVSCLLPINEESHILLGRRHRDASFLPGKWCFIGEHVKAGETYLAAAVRCYKEELGRRIKKTDAICMETGLRMVIKGKGQDKSPFTERQIQNFYGVEELRSARDIAFNRDELSEIRFVAPPEILGEYLPQRLFVPTSSSYFHRLNRAFRSI